MEQLDRITQQPEVMGGRACVRGMRVTVGMIVGMIGSGHTIEELLADYPYLEREDILQALRYRQDMGTFFEVMTKDSDKLPHLSDEALTRESFYQDHD